MQVLVPGTPDELERLFRATYANGHITYLRPSTATNAESREVEVGRLDVVRRGTRATVVAVGPMLDRTLAAVEGMDVTVLYVTSVSPFDADGLAREVADGPDVISVAPFLEGTLTPMLTSALAAGPRASRRSASAATCSREYGTVGTITTALGAWTSAGSVNGSRESSSDSDSAYAVPMTELPSDVLMRLGPSPQDLTRLGSSRVLRGNGLVAKSGTPEGIAREAFLFGEAAALLPVGAPTLVASGPGWILMEDVGGEPVSPDDVTPLARLAPMHELFVGATGIEHERFRDVFGRERDGLLALARGSANAAALPEPLSTLLDDPSPLDVDHRR